jgi:hypothetical protein
MEPISLTVLLGGAWAAKKLAKMFGGSGGGKNPPPAATGYGDDSLRYYADGCGDIGDGQMFIWIAFRPGKARAAIARFGLTAIDSDSFMDRHVVPAMRRGVLAPISAQGIASTLDQAEAAHPRCDVYVVKVG